MGLQSEVHITCKTEFDTMRSKVWNYLDQVKPPLSIVNSYALFFVLLEALLSSEFSDGLSIFRL